MGAAPSFGPGSSGRSGSTTTGLVSVASDGADVTGDSAYRSPSHANGANSTVTAAAATNATASGRSRHRSTLVSCPLISLDTPATSSRILIRTAATSTSVVTRALQRLQLSRWAMTSSVGWSMADLVMCVIAAPPLWHVAHGARGSSQSLLVSPGVRTPVQQTGHQPRLLRTSGEEQDSDAQWPHRDR